MFYDPEGDGFDSDPEIDRLAPFFENYMGRGLIKLVNKYDMVRDIEVTRNIYMKAVDTGEIFVFDEHGNEVKVLEAVKDAGSTEYFGPGYLITRIEDVEKKFHGQEYVLYDVDAAKQYRLHIWSDKE